MNPKTAALAVNIMAMLGLPASEAFQIHQPDGAFVPNRVVSFDEGVLNQGVAISKVEQFGQPMAINAASQFASNNPHEFLTNYAVRYTDPLQTALRDIRERIAPEVMSNNSSYVDYQVFGFADAFLALDNALDARRAIGTDYPTMQNTRKDLVSQRLPDIGLAVEVDEEEELLESNWQERKVEWLLGILDRTELRTAIALLVAGATNVNKTWDVTAGKDPDQDVNTEIDAMMIKPNNIIYGPGAWTKRSLALRAQNIAGQANSSTLTVEQLGGYFNADLLVPRNRYATGAATTANVIGSIVMLFSAMSGMTRDDFSNLKTFVAPAKGGQKRAVWVRQVGDKRWRIVVSTGKRLVALTSAIGLETITVS